MEKSKDVMNFLISKFDYKSYLEVGVQLGRTFSEVKCDKKVGVDILKRFDGLTHTMSSDKYFETHDETFDLIFIDGLHEAEQVLKDFENAEKVLNEGGTIVFHDVLPPSRPYQLRTEREALAGGVAGWTGDVWKAWIVLRQSRSDLTMFCVEGMPGHGIIQRGSQETLETNLELKDLHWPYFIEDRDRKMNVVSAAEFEKMYD